MELNLAFFLTSAALGAGLSMDAFSVSLANGLNEPHMGKGKMNLIALVFGAFQALMPFVGWICVHTLVEYFTAFQPFIPWIALGLLCFVGGKMLLDGIRCKGEECCCGTKLTVGALLVQGVATSIDALSIGFTIAGYDLLMAIVANAVIGAVTYAVCLVGILIGRKFGTRLSGKAQILGGIILIVIGLEIFITGVL